MIIDILLCFLFIFAFPLGKSIFDSSLLLLCILILEFIVDSKYRKNVFILLQMKKTVYITITLCGICIYSALMTVLNMKYDFSIIKTFLHQGISLISALMLVAFYKKRESESNIYQYIVCSFFIQSLIQFISMVSPTFREITNFLRTEDMIIRGQHTYSGIRGLAISSNGFFGLAVAYGIVYMLCAFKGEKINITKNLFLKVVMGLLLIFGGISAGRTALIGLAFSIGITLYKKIKSFNIRKKGFKNLLIILFLIVIISISINKIENISIPQFRYFYNYASEFVRNLTRGNGLTSTSTTHLFKDMYFDIDIKTILIGEGKYVSDSGNYYKGTDAGYMRNLLYFGIGGIIILFFLQLQFFYWKKKEEYARNICMIVYILILHIKGETLGFLIIQQSIFALLLYQRFFSLNDTKEINKEL